MQTAVSTHSLNVPQVRLKRSKGMYFVSLEGNPHEAQARWHERRRTGTYRRSPVLRTKYLGECVSLD